MSEPWENDYAGSRVLITGGLGFIGSSLAIRMVDLGADVTIVDNLLADHGGNPFNIEPIAAQVTVAEDDIRDAERMNHLVQGQDFVFHLAGQCDHVRSVTEPFLDVDIRVKGTLVVLEACRRGCPDARIVYAGTRGEYGEVDRVPVAESAPTNPKGIYELTSLTAQHLFRIYAENHGLQTIGTRLTNVYGERSQMQHAKFGVANWFVRLAIDDETIKVFGTGTIKRDFLYIDDCTEALARLAVAEGATGDVFNIGSDEPSCFLELAETAIEQAGSGRLEMVPFTPERAAQEPGDYVSDISKVGRATGWRPTTSLPAGIGRTIEYYKANKQHYW